MKISQFISKLEEYKQERGDLEMLFSVRDYYSVTGCDAHHIFANGRFWEGTMSNGEQVRFELSLNHRQYPNEPIKHPKITFRK